MDGDITVTFRIWIVTYRDCIRRINIVIPRIEPFIITFVASTTATSIRGQGDIIYPEIVFLIPVLIIHYGVEIIATILVSGPVLLEPIALSIVNLVLSVRVV